MISRSLALPVFYLLGNIVFNLIYGVAYLVPAAFDPRLRTRALLLKGLAVSIASALVIIGITQSHGSFQSYWMVTSLARAIIFGLFGYEIAQHRLR
jgi:uncharacterized membrane protein YagU involved in acid resistance